MFCTLKFSINDTANCANRIHRIDENAEVYKIGAPVAF